MAKKKKVTTKGLPEIVEKQIIHSDRPEEIEYEIIEFDAVRTTFKGILTGVDGEGFIFDESKLLESGTIIDTVLTPDYIGREIEIEYLGMTTGENARMMFEVKA